VSIWNWETQSNTPIDLAVVQERLPSLEASWDRLAYVVKDEDSLFWDIMLDRGEHGIGIEHGLQQIRFANHELGVYGFEMVGDFVWRVRGICSGKCPTGGYDTQCNDWIVYLENNRSVVAKATARILDSHH
jgi:hypothetical protein